MSTTDRMRMLDRIDRALTMLDCAEAIRDGGGAVEIAGVRITQGGKRPGFPKPGDDLAEAGRNDDDGSHPRGVCGDREISVTGALLVCTLDPGHEGAHFDMTSTDMRGADDRAGKGSTAARTGARSDAQPAEAPGEGRSEIGPQKGVQGLGDVIRAEAAELRGMATGEPYVVGVRPEVLRWTADAINECADRADALEAERDRLAADIAIMRDAGMKAIVAERKRTKKAEAERDEARRARKVSQDLARQARTTADAIQQATRERAEYAEQQRDEAEAAVARVRKVLPDLLAAYRATGAATPVVAVLETARVLVDGALDWVDAGGEA